ncbi:MAG TPA: hypothetical protein VGG34_08480 [Opitutaceae bacterium]|jgi:hypothetical protein
MNVEVDPNLLNADPRIRARAYFLLDAALFHGHYYLYYGVVPAVLVLYPYYVITGKEISPSAATLIFWLVGFLAAVGLLFELRKRLAADWGTMPAILGVSLLAVAPGTAGLVRGASFYTLPIVAGYACLSIFSLGFLRALQERPSNWALAITGLSAGLAVGCRPNLIFVLPIFACGLAVSVERRRLLRSLAFAVAPALAVGIFLAWYNWARFGSIADFGFSHGLNRFFGSGHAIWSWSFLPANFSWYLLTPPSFAPWFPFEFCIGGRAPPPGYGNAEAMYGFLTVTVVALLAAVGYCLSVRQGARRRIPRAWAICLASWSVSEAFFVFGLGIRADRYAPDFLVPAVALTVLLGLVAYGAQFRFAAVYRSALIVAAAATCIHAVFANMDSMHYTRPRTFGALSSWLNPKESTAESLGAAKAGPVRLALVFRRPQSAKIVGLYSTGVAAYRDTLNATVFPNGYVSFQIFHQGYGGPTTALIPVEWDKTYQLGLSMGSLFPPLEDPYFKGWDKGQSKRAKEFGWLSLEKRTLIKRYMKFFKGSPGSRQVASHPGVAQVISVSAMDALPDIIKRPEVTPPAAYRLDVAFTGVRSFGPTPLLCSGQTGDGDLLFLDPLPSGQYRLAIDQWGTGCLLGSPFDIDLTKPSVVEIVAGPALSADSKLGPLVSEAQLDQLQSRLVIWWNGKPVADFTVTEHLQSFDHLLVGRNDSGFTSAAAEFAGSIHEEPMDEGSMLQLVNRALQDHRPNN